jgi:hypothetical protein
MLCLPMNSEHPTGRLEPFPLASVRLSPGIFREQEEINARYLDSLTVDRLLHSFRVTAGISSSANAVQGLGRSHLRTARPLCRRALSFCRRAGSMPVRQIPFSRTAAMNLSPASRHARRRSEPAI